MTIPTDGLAKLAYFHYIVNLHHHLSHHTSSFTTSTMSTEPPLSPQRRFVTVTEDEDLDLDALLIDDSFSDRQDVLAPPLSPHASWSPRGSVPISAIEEDQDANNSEWILPPSSQPGDFLMSSIHRVPSKSILKKVSSYGNFDINESISTSKRGGSIMRKTSFLSFDVSVGSGGAGSGSRAGSDYGLDLDSSSQSQMSTSFLGGAKISSSPAKSASSTDGVIPKSNADEAAGTLDTSLGSSKLSTSGKMRRNVSFNAVNVREYDRTVGDNVSLQLCYWC
jgi:hypothetical protein